MSRSFTKILIPMAAAAFVACGDADRLSSGFKARLDAVLDTKSKEPTPDQTRDALTRQLRVASSDAAVFPSRDTIAGFYAKHGNKLVWSDEVGRPNAGTAVLLDALRRAGENGLNPADYGADRLFSLEKELGDRPKDAQAPQRLADFDLLATTAFFRYASDLATGRVHPDEVQQDWHTHPPEVDIAAALDEALAKTDLPGLLALLPPPHPGYARLREALGALREIDAAGGWPLVPPGERLGPRSTGPRVEALRQRLAQPPGNAFDLAVERITAAKAALAGTGVLLTARTEGFLWGRPDMDETLRRMTAFAEAGADVLYAPGLRQEEQIAQLVRAVAPKPVNVLTPGMSVATLADLGVRRISVGGSLARTAWGGFLKAAREIAQTGTFDAFAQGAPGGELNKLFAEHLRR